MVDRLAAMGDRNVYMIVAWRYKQVHNYSSTTYATINHKLMQFNIIMSKESIIFMIIIILYILAIEDYQVN